MAHQSLNRDRPLGVWLLTIANSFFAALGIYLVSPGLQDPIPHAWSPAAAQWAPYVIGLLVGVILAAIGTWAGNKYARNTLLVLMTVMIGLNLQEDYYGIPFALAEAEKHPDLWFSAGFWWAITSGLRWVIWLAFNYWYFFGARTQTFYLDRQATHA